MKIKQSKNEDGTLTYECMATASEVNNALQQAQENFAMQMGLMPEANKTVAQVAQEKMGIRDLDSIVAAPAAESLIPLALDKKNMIPAFPPKMEDASSFQRGKAFNFTIVVTPRPEYELTSYEPVTVEAVPFSIDESLVDEEMSSMAKGYTAYVKDEEAPADRQLASGDFAKISIQVSSGNDKFDKLNTPGRIYAVGAGHMPESFDGQIQGMKAGDRKSFTFQAPTFDEQMNEAVEDVDVDVEVLEILKEVTPEIDDEWVRKNAPMFKTADEMRKVVRKNIEIKERDSYDAYIRQAVAAEWAKRFEGSIADEVYENMIRQLRDNLQVDVQKAGKSWEDFLSENGGENQITMMLMMQARDVLTQGYALDAVFRHFGLHVEAKDLEEICHAMNPEVDPRELRLEIERRGQGFALRESAERFKANKFAVEQAIIEYPEKK